VVIRDKEGREVARVNVPEGGSVVTEDSGVEASELSKRPTDKAIDGGRIPTRITSEERMKAPATAPGANGPDAENSAPRNGDPRPPSTVDRPPISDAPKPFVVVRAGGKDRQEFKRFADAVSTLRNGDEIEIHGNGPFSVPAIRLDNKGLVIRAAPGYRPVLVASGSLAPDKAWFEVRGGSLNLEGCDFHGGGEAVSFRGGGAPWEWRNCRFWSRAGLFALVDGPLAIDDSLVWSGQLSVRGGRQAKLELTNNIMRFAQNGISVEGEAGRVALAHNTFLNGAGVLLQVTPPRGEPIDIETDGNIFDLRLGPAIVQGHGPDGGGVEGLQQRIRWRGQHNLYCGSNAPLIQDIGGVSKIEGLAAWKEYWDTEETGSAQSPDVSFAWDSARTLPAPEAIAWLRGVVECAKRNEAKDLPELGPEWDLIGPGEAYLRALAARGEPVSPENLRPEPTDEGPFIVLREGKPLGGHATLQEALNAVKSGDAIEIRTDGPFSGGTTDADSPLRGRKLVVRAAPGYLPVLEGDLLYPYCGDLTAEGIHFNGGVDPQFYITDSLHLVNCSFAPATQGQLFGMGSFRDKQSSSEIVNCWAPGLSALLLDDGTSISIRNSVVGSMFLAAVGPGEGQLRIERSVLWNPGCGAVQNRWQGQCAFVRHPGEPISLALQNTLVETALGLVPSGGLADGGFGWANNHNVYRTGASNLVERLRAECHSGDEGSLTAPPFDFDPHQWRLLPGSPGYQAGPDDKDLGADVSRIATVAVAAPAVAAAVRDGEPAAAAAGGLLPASPPRSVAATLRERPNPLDGRPLRSHGIWLDRLPAEAPVVARLGDPRLVGLPNVCRLAYSPDGNLLAAAGDDRLVVLYDTKTWKILHTLRGHTSRITALAFHPDGTLLASSSAGEIKLWQVDTGEEKLSLAGGGECMTNNGFINTYSQGRSLAFVLGGEQLAVRSASSIRLHRADSGELLREVKVGGGILTDIAASADGSRLAACSAEGATVRIWSLAEDRDPLTFNFNFPGGVGAQPYTTAFHPAGKTIAVGGIGRAVGIWDSETGNLLREFVSPHQWEGGAWAHCLAFSSDGKMLVCGGHEPGGPNGYVDRWETASGTARSTLWPGGYAVLAVAFSPDGRQLAVPVCWFGLNGVPDRISVFDPDDGRQIMPDGAHSAAVSGLALATSGDWLASASYDGTVRTWDLEKLQSTRTFQAPHDEKASLANLLLALAVSPDGQWLAGAVGNKEVRLWERSGRGDPLLLPPTCGKPNSLAFSPDSRLLAIGAADRVLRVWNVTSGNEVWKLAGKAEEVRAVAFSPDGKRMASGGKGNFVDLWDVASGQEAGSFGGPGGDLVALGFLDDRRLALGKASGDVQVRALPSGESLVTLRSAESAGELIALAIQPGGDRLATAHADSTLRIWNLKTRKIEASFPLADARSQILQVSFTPEGRYLAAAMVDGSILLVRKDSPR
jgi:WD40 repeat protein